jgi:hypothetical protein
MAVNASRAARSCSRAATRRPARRSLAPYSSRVRAASKASGAWAWAARAASKASTAASSPATVSPRQRATRAAVGGGAGSGVTAAYRSVRSAASATRLSPT